jgi:hypothetical protein
MTKVMRVVLFASLSTAVLAAPADYFAIQGAYYGNGNQSACQNSADPTIGMQCANMIGPEVDRRAITWIPGVLLPIDTMLSIADANGAELFTVEHAVPNDLGHLSLEWLPRTADGASKQTTYVHKTRCRDGVQGVVVKTANAIYKKCPNAADILRVSSVFQLPPYLCGQTCDKTTKCVGYTIDAAGQNCWILAQPIAGHETYDTFWKTGAL